MGLIRDIRKSDWYETVAPYWKESGGLIEAINSGTRRWDSGRVISNILSHMVSQCKIKLMKDQFSNKKISFPTAEMQLWEHSPFPKWFSSTKTRMIKSDSGEWGIT